MKPGQILKTLILFLGALSLAQTTLQISKAEGVIGYLKLLGSNFVTITLGFIVAAPLAVLLAKKYEKNDRK